jgi:hypothetical protein
MNASCTVVLVSYHTGDVLFDTIKAVLKQQPLDKLIIVNNGNPPEIVARLETLAQNNPAIDILSGHGNIGFGSGCNLGAENAKGDYILLLNPDCVLSPDALTTAIIEMENHPDTWLAGCRHVLPDGSLQRMNKRRLLNLITFFSEALKLHTLCSLFPSINLSEQISDTESEYIPAISGAFMMMPKDKFQQVGGMDEDYFLHVEDLDLCKRVHNAGGKVLYMPSVQSLHHLSTSDVSSHRINGYKARSFIRYFLKHGLGISRKRHTS